MNQNWTYIYTRWQLINALMTGGPLGPLQVVNGVERESGDNKTYNVTGITNLKNLTIFVKVED